MTTGKLPPQITKPSPPAPKAKTKRAFETDEDNVVRQDQAKGEVRPDGPGDATAPVGQETPKAPRTKEPPARHP